MSLATAPHRVKGQVEGRPRDHDPAPGRTDGLALDERKILASLLLKDLRGDDGPSARRAAERFEALPYLRSGEPDAILGRRASIRHKHALAVVAAELGFATWAECKRRLETPPDRRLDTETFFAKMGAAYLNRWFAGYDEARASLEAEGGYLFPFHRQYFVCEVGFLERGASIRPTPTGSVSAAAECGRATRWPATASSGSWSPWATAAGTDAAPDGLASPLRVASVNGRLDFPGRPTDEIGARIASRPRPSGAMGR